MNKLVNESGVTLSILVLTIVVMAILITTIGISVTGYADVKTLKTFYNDLEIVREKTDVYYQKNKELPVSEKITFNMVTLLGESRNANDGDVYYKVDLSLLDDMNLTYGVKDSINNYYIVNEESHNIYFYPGITVSGNTYYGIKDVSESINTINFSVPSYELKTEVLATVTNGVPNIQLKVYADIINANISKYKFKIDNNDWTPAQDDNSYIFDNLEHYKTYTVSMMIIDKNGNEIYATNNGKKVTIQKLPINLTIDGKTTGTYNNPLIPAGFYAVNENNAIWQSSDGYKNGLVITDEIDENGNSTGNEFVWVPVDGEIVKFERYDWGKGNVNYTACTETVPTEITTSVNKNQGFYIARYEAGIAENMPNQKLTSNSTATYGNGTYQPVSKKDAYVWNYIQWGTNNNDSTPGNGAVTVARSMYPSSDKNYGVTSTLIYGVQWDTTLKFIGVYNTGEAGYNTYATNSTGMGNYSGTSGGDDIDSYWNSPSDNSGPTICGARETFRQKNIYDMAGNVWEWTMEKYSTSQISRGGAYGNSALECPSSYRNNSYPDYIGVRFPCSPIYKRSLNRTNKIYE